MAAADHDAVVGSDASCCAGEVASAGDRLVCGVYLQVDKHAAVIADSDVRGYVSGVPVSDASVEG